jgi:hypothetical protein
MVVPFEQCPASGKYPWPVFSPRGPSLRDRGCALHAVRSDLTAPGFTVTTVPLTALGRREDGSRATALSSRAEPARPECARRRTAPDRGLSPAWQDRRPGPSGCAF